MPTIAAPGLTTTPEGSALPLVALPQDDLLSLNSETVGWLTDTLAPGIDFKPLRIDLERNEWVLLLRAAPGVELPVHYHTGPAEVYTLQGRWYYKEYPDNPQTAGSYLYEPSGSVHQFHTPADNTEDTLAFVRVAGANVNFNPDGTFHSILDALSLRYLSDAFSEQQHGSPARYIDGGETALPAGGN